MAKLHFRSYTTNQMVLFPQRIDENIAENDPVRIVSSIVDHLDMSSVNKLYNGMGRCPYHPRMMLKVIIYAYMNNIYSCRRIEQLLLRDIHFIWLAGYEKPDFITINRFRNRLKDEINNIFTQLVLILATKGYDVQFGARPLKRAIQNYLEDGLSELIISAGLQPGDTINVSVNKEKDELNITKA